MTSHMSAHKLNVFYKYILNRNIATSHGENTNTHLLSIAMQHIVQCH